MASDIVLLLCGRSAWLSNYNRLFLSQLIKAGVSSELREVSNIEMFCIKCYKSDKSEACRWTHRLVRVSFFKKVHCDVFWKSAAVVMKRVAAAVLLLCVLLSRVYVKIVKCLLTVYSASRAGMFSPSFM